MKERTKERAEDESMRPATKEKIDRLARFFKKLADEASKRRKRRNG